MSIEVKAHMHRRFGHAANVAKNKPLRVELGENVAAIMAAKKLSQVKVAAAAKKAKTPIDQTTVSRVVRAGKQDASKEESEYPTTVDTIEAIANGLGVQPWELLIPGRSDEKLLAILQAWSITSDVGKELLGSAAAVALERYGPDARIRESKG